MCPARKSHETRSETTFIDAHRFPFTIFPYIFYCLLYYAKVDLFPHSPNLFPLLHPLPYPSPHVPLHFSSFPSFSSTFSSSSSLSLLFLFFFLLHLSYGLPRPFVSHFVTYSNKFLPIKTISRWIIIRSNKSLRPDNHRTTDCLF